MYKHGEGSAFDTLIASHPEYFEDPISEQRRNFEATLMGSTYEDLKICEEHIDKFANAISEFWDDFPEYLRVPNGSDK